MTTSLSDTGVTFADNSVQASAAAPQVAPISASVTSNAITVTLAPCSLAFRNTTLTTGVPTYLANNTTLSLTIAATDSFGLTTAFGTQRLAILCFNDAGTMRLAATALYGGVQLDETNLLSTTTTATTATAIDAGVVITSKAYRVVGFVDAPFTTAVGWGALVLVQGQGGQALAAMSSFGYGQTSQDLTGSRALSTTYYNTGKPIELFVQCTAGAGNQIITITTEGNAYVSSGSGAAGYSVSITKIIRSGATYAVTSAMGVTKWFETR